MELFHHELNKLKNIFCSNGYPNDMIDNCIKIFFNKLYNKKPVMYTVPRKEVLSVLPYLGKLSLELRTRLNKIFRSKIPTCKLVIFRLSVRIKNFFGFKDKIPRELKSGLVYRFKCGGCNTTYYGKTIRHFHVRIYEHLGISPLTGKVLTTLNRTAISDHLADTPTCYATTDNFDILSRDVVDYKLLIKESLFIKRDDPPLNRTIKSIPLSLFD